MKWITTLIILIIFMPLVLAINECKGTIYKKDIPCTVLGSWNYPLACSNYNISVWNSTPANIINYTMGTWGAGRCNITWNITAPGAYFLNYSSGDSAHILVGVNNMELTIMLTLLVFMIIGSFFTYYAETWLKFAFFLGTALTAVFSLNVLGNMAQDNLANTAVIGLIWFIYRISLIVFFALALYVLITLISQLRAKPNVPPNMGSPMQRVKAERQARKNGYFNQR